jgi:hypothetical protein
MKKTFPFLLFFLLSFVITLQSFSQLTNLVFFSEQGERFSVVLNGILQNAKPETNIKVVDLPGPSYKLKILFEDKNIPDIDKNLMFQQGTETTFNIRKNNKGEYVARFYSQFDLNQLPPPPPGQAVVVFTTVPATGVVVNQTNVTNVTNLNNNSTTINTSANDVNGNVSISISGSAAQTTSSSTAVSTSSQVNSHSHTDHYEMPGYSGAIGCPYPLTDLDFQDVKRTIASKSFEDSKLSIAKQVTSANCLLASEVKQIMELFSFESSRLDFAKYAYRYTYDIGNYYKVNTAFQFESSTDELNKFIEEQGR